MIRVRLVLQSACLMCWFLTKNKKRNEQKINLKFCFKLGKTLKETHVMMVRVYEDQALSMKYKYEWFTHYLENQKSVSEKTS